MKLHLPKLLLAALLGCSMAYAYSEGENITIASGDDVLADWMLPESVEMPNVTINQSGGSVVVGLGGVTVKGESDINQSGGEGAIDIDESTLWDNWLTGNAMFLGDCRVVENAKLTVNQSGSGAIQIGIDGSHGDPGSFDFNQTGDGQISINGIGSENIKTTISQSGAGTIKLNFSTAFKNFTVNQTNSQAKLILDGYSAKITTPEMVIGGSVSCGPEGSPNLSVNKLVLLDSGRICYRGNADTMFTITDELVYEVADKPMDARITLEQSSKVTLTENFKLTLRLMEGYTGESMKIAIAQYKGESNTTFQWLTNNTDNTALTLDSVVWTASNLDWLQDGDVLYVTGDLVQNDEVVIDRETEVSESIRDKGEKAVKVTITADTTLSSGKNTYTGGTVIKGATLKLEEGATVGSGDVWLTSTEGGCGVFDMGGNALTNKLIVTGCILRNAQNYQGDMEVSHELEIEGVATAKKVTLKGEGTLVRDAQLGGSLSADALDVQTTGDATLDIDLAINDSGEITLRDGKKLSVKGSLTLGKGVSLLLSDDDYGVGDTLLSSTGALTMGDVTLVYNDSTVELEHIGNTLVLVSKFKQDKADAVAQGNWGIATASRAFVNTVRGQRSNTGCIANGKGTAWFSLLGASNNLKGGDVSVEGAAVGADMKVGKCSVLGVAFGYADGTVSPAGLRKVEQDGFYAAVYGEHGLKKLSADSCLSLDWVAAYGDTESDWNGMEWAQDSLQLNTRLSWNKKMTDRLCMSVFGGLEYFASESDTVNGVKTGSIQNLRGELGVGLSYVAWGTPDTAPVTDEKGGLVSAGTGGCRKLVLHGELRYFNDLVRSNPVVEMSGIRGMGTNPGRQGFGVEAGATYRINDRWSTSANYGFNAMEDSQEHRVNVGASYTF